MALLRLTQHAEADGTYRVELAIEGHGLARQIAVARFSFELTAQDEADLRWYLEDYLQWPHDPAPKITARVEDRMRGLGTELAARLRELRRIGGGDDSAGAAADRDDRGAACRKVTVGARLGQRKRSINTPARRRPSRP